ISAAIIGIVIGIVLLNVMVKSPSQEGSPVTGNPSENNKTPVQGEQMVLPEQKFYFLQQGVYKSEDSVNQIVSEYTNKKIPVNYIKNGESFHVFIMTIDSIDSGKLIKQQDEYVETWPKEFETSEKVLQNLTKDEKRFIELAFPFYEMIVKESTKSVIDGKEYSITSDYFKDSYEQLKSLKELNKDEIKQ